MNAYVAKLARCIAGTRDVIGFAVTINGKLEGAEIYGSSALFHKMWPKLLRAAAVDAFTEQQQGRRYELAEIDEVKAFLTEGNRGKRTDTDVNSRIRVTTRQGEVSPLASRPAIATAKGPSSTAAISPADLGLSGRRRIEPSRSVSLWRAEECERPETASSGRSRSRLAKAEAAPVSAGVPLTVPRSPLS